MDYDKMVDELIDRSIAEDIGDGDHTTLSTVPVDVRGGARLLVKEPCIIAGLEIAQKIFDKIDSSLALDVFINDGEKVNIGDVVFNVNGKTHSILQAERLVLNFMQTNERDCHQYQ